MLLLKTRKITTSETSDCTTHICSGIFFSILIYIYIYILIESLFYISIAQYYASKNSGEYSIQRTSFPVPSNGYTSVYTIFNLHLQSLLSCNKPDKQESSHTTVTAAEEKQSTARGAEQHYILMQGQHGFELHSKPLTYEREREIERKRHFSMKRL